MADNNYQQVNDSGEHHEGEPDKFLLEHADNDDRLGFVKKVYAILATQLTITFGFVAIVKATPTLNDTLPLLMPLIIVALVLAICIQCALVCCKSVARTTPTNYILLFVFTLCWTFIIGVICAMYETEVVLSAAAMTMVITVSLSLYACFTKNDFTQLCGPFVCWGLIIIFFLSMMMSVLSMLVFTFTETWIPFAAGFAVLVYGLFLLIDTQLVVGGKRHELRIDDYIVGALILYLDIIMIFLELLKIFGGRK